MPTARLGVLSEWIAGKLSLLQSQLQHLLPPHLPLQRRQHRPHLPPHQLRLWRSPRCLPLEHLLRQLRRHRPHLPPRRQRLWRSPRCLPPEHLPLQLRRHRQRLPPHQLRL